MLWPLLFITVGCMACFGFPDDYIKDVKKDHEGLKPKQKIVGQLALGLILAVWAYFYVGSDVIVPFTHKTWDLGVFYIPLMFLLLRRIPLPADGYLRFFVLAVPVTAGIVLFYGLWNLLFNRRVTLEALRADPELKSKSPESANREPANLKSRKRKSEKQK